MYRFRIFRNPKYVLGSRTTFDCSQMKVKERTLALPNLVSNSATKKTKLDQEPGVASANPDFGVGAPLPGQSSGGGGSV